MNWKQIICIIRRKHNWTPPYYMLRSCEAVGDAYVKGHTCKTCGKKIEVFAEYYRDFMDRVKEMYPDPHYEYLTISFEVISK